MKKHLGQTPSVREYTERLAPGGDGKLRNRPGAVRGIRR